MVFAIPVILRFLHERTAPDPQGIFMRRNRVKNARARHPKKSPLEAQIKILSTSSRLTSSLRRSWSWVVRVEAWFAMVAAFSSVPPFLR